MFSSFIYSYHDLHVLIRCIPFPFDSLPSLTPPLSLPRFASPTVNHGLRRTLGSSGVPFIRPPRHAGVVPRATDAEASESVDLEKHREVELCAEAAYAEVDQYRHNGG